VAGRQNSAWRTERANSRLRYDTNTARRHRNSRVGKGGTVDQDERIACHVIVHGRVQGVGFRAFVEHQALQRNLEGWVRNRRDGTVEAVFAGPRRSVEGVIAACKVGPLSAKVDRLDQRVADETELESCRGGELFSCLPTA
jgi:acylphosphatase